MKDESTVSPVSQLDALHAAWSARGWSAEKLTARADGTLLASDRQLTIDSETLALDADAVARPEGGTEEPLEVIAPLGRGGMGVVHVARQHALRREVAVKRRARADAPLDTLLKEAWVGGSLEHPNVVPVHVLALVDGEPAVVMKRIEGVPWSRVLRDPALVPAGERADPFAWHARILVSVCHAMSLAHRRGILHLDLKPENVMIGAFGEVYVLDWGLAAGHGPSAPAWLARASEVRGVAGTPDYMAPELALGAGERITPRTDVYLLGAMLHEVVTGRAPHAADNLLARLYRAYTSKRPEYGPQVSEELAAILHRAMAREADDRFPSVDAFRQALEDHLAHRAADDLVREARAQLAGLEASLAAGAPDDAEVWRAFGACRFALREAEDARRDHPEVPGLRRRLFVAMARWAIEAGRLDLGRAYLDELGEPVPELEERLAALRASADAEAARVRRLEDLAREEDLSVGSRVRSVLAVVLGYYFLVVSAAMAIAEDRGLVEWDYPQLLSINAGSMAVLAPIAIFGGKRIFRNRANVVFFAVCISAFVVVQGYWLASMTLGVPAQSAFALTPIFYILAFGALAVLLSTNYAPSALLQVPTAIAAARWPQHAHEIIGLGAGASAALLGITWRDPARQER